jgi:hypothetical protein
MYVKCVPYPLEPVVSEGKIHEGQRRKNRLIECEDLSYEVRHPLDLDTLLKILDEILDGWSPIWKLPLGGHPETDPDQQHFPDDGLRLVILEVMRIGRETEETFTTTYLAYDCNVYIMSNEGRTIDRI